MADSNAVVAAAERLSDKDEDALAIEIGLRSKLIEADPNARDNPDLVVRYGTHMGRLDDIKALGWRILARFNKELHAVVCTSDTAEDKEFRATIMGALSIDEAALIAVVAPALLALGAPAGIAAAVAPLVVKKFIIPAKEELCAAWGEALEEGE